jgi:hypothetical protein
MKHELQTPITGTDGKLIKSVVIGTVKVKHLKSAEVARRDGDEMMAGIALLAAVTELPVEVIEEMDARDFATISEAMGSFLPKPA